VAWGFAEGSLFFVVPDVLITLSAAFSLRRGLRHLGLAVAGALVAGALMFSWSARAPDHAARAVAAVPAVTTHMFEQVEQDFERSPAWAPCLGPTSGIPYKVYAVAAPKHTSLTQFLIASVPARIERLALTWVQFVAIAWCVRRWTKHPVRWIYGIHAVYWVAMYTYYWFLR